MSSSNPFRKKTLQAGSAARAQSPAKSSLRSNSPRADDRSKPIKKVRVLSPPPLSPASPEWPGSAGGDSEVNVEARDPFNGAAPAPAPASDAAAGAARAVPPANPFSKTLHDLENSKELEDQRKGEGEALKAGNAARNSLNVDSFRRLLMTGKAGDAEDSGTPAASSSRHDGSGEGPSDSPTSSDDSYSNGDGPPSTTSPQQTGKEKKMPPPPPNSRHGKTLIDDHADVPKLSPQTGGVNKPALPSPVYVAEFPLEHGSAGKAPGQEPDLQHRALAAHGRKPAPAPPPRRGQSRTESRNQTLAPSSADEAVPRTSADETPRQTGNVPVPPPPRRPHATPRQTSHALIQSFSTPLVTQAPSPSTHQHDSDHSRSASFELPSATSTRGTLSGNTKLFSPPPPPPPPARHSSVRRPPSVHSVEGTGKRVSGEAKARDGVAPPPPPRRPRGGSSSSIDVPPRRTSAEGVSRPVPEERPSGTGDAGEASDVGQAAADGGKGVDILADLDALQREVDALRGKLG